MNDNFYLLIYFLFTSFLKSCFLIIFIFSFIYLFYFYFFLGYYSVAGWDPTSGIGSLNFGKMKSYFMSMAISVTYNVLQVKKWNYCCYLLLIIYMFVYQLFFLWFLDCLHTMYPYLFIYLFNCLFFVHFAH